MVARSAGFVVSLAAESVSSRARVIRLLTDFITPSACETSASAAFTLADQAVMLACVVPIVAIRRAATGSSDMRSSFFPPDIWICVRSSASASFCWRAISRVMRLPTALIMILTLP